MTWKLNAFGKTRAGVTGVPWRDLTNEEYLYFTVAIGDLSAYFEFEPDAPAPVPARRKR